MADNTKLTNAEFATKGMLPGDDEEVNALWARKAQSSAARSYGEWATLYCSTSAIALENGIATIDFTALGFQSLPEVQYYSVLGGTHIVSAPVWHGESYADDTPNGVMIQYSPSRANFTNKAFITFAIIPEWTTDGALNTRFFPSNQQSFATAIYRVRGA